MTGQTFGHYRIVEKIGAGGMGVVYRAHDNLLKRDVALKVLPAAALADETARARLQREAQTGSALNHPHISTIYEVGEADGQTYIAMELMEGRSLKAIVGGEGLPVEMVIRYGAQIADALAHAHERGILHRDLKTSNVVITPEGRAKVLDFGLARRLAGKDLDEVTRSQDSLTQIGTVVGTLQYLAPEVFHGEKADERSDIWALGVVLYEMGAGALPFQGRTGYELSSAILREPAPPLPARVPASLRAIIQRCLAKEPGQRYQKAGEVRAALEAIHAEAAVAPAEVTVAPAAPRQRVVSRRWALMVAAGLAALLVVLVGLNVSGWRQRLLGRAGPPRIESLAVLPVENLSRDPDQEYFADGMTEALITDLAKISALRVISRTSAMQYKGAKKPLPQIARELNVDAVVEGSVQRAGNHVRITTQLIEAATDRHLWAESYERNLSDVLALQSEVAQAIAGEIRVKVTPQEKLQLTSVRPVSPAAHEAYLRGRYHLNKGTEKEIRKGIEYFEQALQEDGRFAFAYAGLADSYVALCDYYSSPLETMPKAREAARKALELDATIAEAHISLGAVSFLYDRDWPAAEREFKRAIELSPSHTGARVWYASYLAAMGKHEESIAEIRRAQPLGLSANLNWAAAWAFYLAGQNDLAIEQYRKALDLEPNFGLAHAYLGVAYVRKGELQDGVAESQKARQSEDEPMVLAAQGVVYGLVGKRDEAQRILQELNERSTQQYVCPYETAKIRAVLGKKEEAFKWLEKGSQEREPCLVWLKADPEFERLRSDPRFQDLLRRVGLPQ